MDLSVLNTTGQDLFPKLHTASVHQNAYLAGGTALALQLKHRYSFDFNFFTPKLPKYAIWEQEMRSLGEFQPLQTHNQGHIGYVNQVQISLTTYKHKLLTGTLNFHSIRILQLEDLAAMKLFALLDRRRRRDIYDLYFLAQRFDLTEMLIFFEYKYSGVEISEPVILKRLNELDSIPDEPVNLIQAVSWDEVKNFWQKEVKRYVRDRI